MKQRFNKSIIYCIVFCSLCFAGVVKADILLLVHGFQSDMLTWQRANIIPVLQKHGWEKTDYIIAAPQGIAPIHTPEELTKNKIAILHLNSEIRLRDQANMVTAGLIYLSDLYPNEPVYIVGHSLGGLVARLSIVKNGVFQVKGLITIATPHLGTQLARVGLNKLNGNVIETFAKRFFGGSRYNTLERSRPVLHNILPELPGNLLYQLNRQPHPNIKYVSVVRSYKNGVLGDVVVPGFSQDMENIDALKGSTVRILQGFRHELVAQDGYSIINALEMMKK